MFFGLFKNAEVDQAANTMAERFAKRYPADLQTGDKPVRQEKLTAATSSLYSDLNDLRRRVRLGTFRRAQFANTLKWALKDRGYKDEIVNSVVYDLLFYLARPK